MKHDTDLMNDDSLLSEQVCFKVSEQDLRNLERVQKETQGYLAQRDRAFIVRYAVRKLIKDIFGD